MFNDLLVQAATAVIGLVIGVYAWSTGAAAVNLITTWILR